MFGKDKTNGEPKIKLNIPKTDTDANVQTMPSGNEIQVTKNIDEADVRVLSKAMTSTYIRIGKKKM